MSKVGILIADAYQDEEVTQPREFFMQAGVEVELIGPLAGEYKGKYGRARLTADVGIDAVNAANYDAVIIPGGSAPEHMRVDDRFVGFIREFAKTGRPIGAICHGPQLLISADLLKGRVVTCYVGIRDDVKLAGALYEDVAVKVDGNLVTSRQPADIPAFEQALLALLKHEAQV